MLLSWMALSARFALGSCFFGCLLLVMPVAQELEVAEIISPTGGEVDYVVNILAWISASVGLAEGVRV